MARQRKIPTAKTHTCTRCEDTKDATRLPSGWKSIEGKVVCAACVSCGYVTRAVTFAVDGVEGGTWKEFTGVLHQLWRESVAASNWCIQHYVKIDTEPRSGGEKLPTCPKLYAYGLLTKRFHGVNRGTLACISNNTAKHYRKHRNRIWYGQEAVPLYRYPAPLPIRAEDWESVWADKEPGVPCAGVRCQTGHQQAPGGSTLRTWVLRLSGGVRFARQMAAFRQIMGKDATPLEMSLYRQRCGDTGRNQTVERSPGGGNKVKYRVMCKIVARFPRRPKVQGVGQLLVCTGPDAFLTAVHDGRVEAPWVINADQVRRWIRAHAAYRQRMSEDLKYEKRWPKATRKRMVEALQKRCDKQQRRLRTFIQQHAAMAAGYAERQGVAEVVLDDTCRTYLPSFPWYAFKVTLRNKLDELGIGFVASMPDEPGEEKQQESAEGQE